jgi:hypothetical protein
VLTLSYKASLRPKNLIYQAPRDKNEEKWMWSKLVLQRGSIMSASNEKLIKELINLGSDKAEIKKDINQIIVKARTRGKKD